MDPDVVTATLKIRLAGVWTPVTPGVPSGTNPPPGGGGGGGTNPPATHGAQITRNNTGHLAYVGPAGQTYTDATLVVVNGTVNASALGASVTGRWFKGTVHIDSDITFTACRFDQPVSTSPTYNHATLNYCTVSPTSVGDWALGPLRTDATRCILEGNSDGVRFDSCNLVECWIRTKLQSAVDHNDGIQAYLAGAGGSILRCNIDCRPINGGNGTTTAAIFLADSSQGTCEIRDNYLAGGSYTLRLHESMFYRVTGNIIENNSWAYGAMSTSNSVAGAFLEWSNNMISNGTALAHP